MMWYHFSFSQLSLPSVGTAGVDLVSAVDESIRDVVVDFENRMLQDEGHLDVHFSGCCTLEALQ